MKPVVILLVLIAVAFTHVARGQCPTPTFQGTDFGSTIVPYGYSWSFPTVSPTCSSHGAQITFQVFSANTLTIQTVDSENLELFQNKKSYNTIVGGTSDNFPPGCFQSQTNVGDDSVALYVIVFCEDPAAYIGCDFDAFYNISCSGDPFPTTAPKGLTNLDNIIIGAVVGGGGGLLILIIIVLCCRRSRARRMKVITTTLTPMVPVIPVAAPSVIIVNNNNNNNNVSGPSPCHQRVAKHQRVTQLQRLPDHQLHHHQRVCCHQCR